MSLSVRQFGMLPSFGAQRFTEDIRRHQNMITNDVEKHMAQYEVRAFPRIYLLECLTLVILSLRRILNISLGWS